MASFWSDTKLGAHWPLAGTWLLDVTFPKSACMCVRMCVCVHARMFVCVCVCVRIH